MFTLEYLQVKRYEKKEQQKRQDKRIKTKAEIGVIESEYMRGSIKHLRRILK